jgi:hypothetical protein
MYLINLNQKSRSQLLFLNLKAIYLIWMDKLRRSNKSLLSLQTMEEHLYSTWTANQLQLPRAIKHQYNLRFRYLKVYTQLQLSRIIQMKVHQ